MRPVTHVPLLYPRPAGKSEATKPLSMHEPGMQPCSPQANTRIRLGTQNLASMALPVTIPDLLPCPRKNKATFLGP